MTDHSIAKAISMHRTPEGVIEAAVEHAHAKLAADVGFAALAAPADGFQISQKLGIADPRWSNIVVRPGLGLGGQVLASGRPMLVDDYAHDRRISRDFVEIVSHGEGLRAVACVPVLGPGATEALLYVGSRTAGRLGERALDELRLIAEFAAIGTEQLRTRSLELELDRLREREHLASRLHDSVAQRLFAIGALATALRSESDVATLLEAVDEIEATAADARRELRATLLHLNEDADHLSFHLQLDGELRLLERLSGCSVRVTRRGRSRQMPRHVERLLIDSALEGTRNAIKHCSARLVAVEVAYEDRQVRLAVEAQRTRPAGAAGAQAGGPGSSGTGIGLSALSNRAERLGGTLSFEQPAGSPGVLLLTLPLHSSEL